MGGVALQVGLATPETLDALFKFPRRYARRCE